MKRVALILFVVLFLCSSASALTMTFAQGKIHCWEDYSTPEDRVFNVFDYNGGFFESYPDRYVVGYEENGMYFEINEDYEVYFGFQGPFHTTYIDNPLTFYLTSNKKFNLDYIDLVIASNVSRWDIGDDCPFVQKYDVDYIFTASNGADFIIPGSNDLQNIRLYFDDSFNNINYFNIAQMWYGAGAWPDDPAFVLGSISVTPIPEPSTMLLMGLGIVGIFGSRKLCQSTKELKY